MLVIQEDHVGFLGGEHHHLVRADRFCHVQDLLGPDRLAEDAVCSGTEFGRGRHAKPGLGLGKDPARDEVRAEERPLGVHPPHLLPDIGVAGGDEGTVLCPLAHQQGGEVLDTLAPPVDIALTRERAHAPLPDQVSEAEFRPLSPDERRLPYERVQLAHGPDRNEDPPPPAAREECGEYTRFSAPCRCVDEGDAAVTGARRAELEHLALVGAETRVGKEVLEGRHRR